MPEPVIASVGASPFGCTDHRARDLFSVALVCEKGWPVHVVEPR